VEFVGKEKRWLHSPSYPYMPIFPRLRSVLLLRERWRSPTVLPSQLLLSPLNFLLLSVMLISFIILPKQNLVVFRAH